MNIWSLFRGCDLPRPKSAIITHLCESAQIPRGIKEEQRQHLQMLSGRFLAAKNEHDRLFWAKLFVCEWASLSGKAPGYRDGLVLWCNRGDLL